MMNKERLLAFRIKFLHNQIRRMLERTAMQENHANLTGMQYAFLGFISDRSEAGNVYQRDIEAEFNIRRSTASGMLQYLEKAGLIRRESVPDDARLKKILLTPKALEVDKAAKKNLLALQETLTNHISSEEMDEFYRILDKILKNAEA